jgi:hypothetical protein
METDGVYFSDQTEKKIKREKKRKNWFF